jgi:hypothetical protein
MTETCKRRNVGGDGVYGAEGLTKSARTDGSDSMQAQSRFTPSGEDECEGDTGADDARPKAHVTNLSLSLLHPDLEELGLALPMPVTEAQRTHVFLQQGFLSREEAGRLIRKFNGLGLQPYINAEGEDYNAKGEWVHVTRYLQTGDCFREKFGELRDRIIALARHANAEQGWGLDMRAVSVRVAEFHNYRRGGSLRDMQHYDKGSLVTVDIMLQPPIAGGEFQTPLPGDSDRTHGDDGDHDSAHQGAQGSLTSSSGPTADEQNDGGVALGHSFPLGAALAFVSHKYHRVAPVLEGERKVLVVEL